MTAHLEGLAVTNDGQRREQVIDGLPVPTKVNHIWPFVGRGRNAASYPTGRVGRRAIPAEVYHDRVP